MTKTEKALFKAKQDFDKAYRKLHAHWTAKIGALREALGDECTHPAEALEGYQWEHDNGYGHQHMNTGRRCTLCGAKKPSDAYTNFIRDFRE